MSVETPERVDLVWATQGRRIPLDHGYVLYSALSRALPLLHEAPWLSVHPIRGMHAGGGFLQLAKQTRLTLRLPPERIAAVLPLAGRTLDLGGNSLVVGVPSIHSLTPAAVVSSRLVVVRLTKAPKGAEGKLQMDAFREAFEKEARRQLADLSISGPIEVGKQRQIHVGAQRIVGFGVTVHGLTPEQSLRLQCRGIGGKHRMGCGIFLPVHTAR